MSDKIKELIARVEGAEGPDDALDEAIIQAVWPEPVKPYEIALCITASVDAALALCEQLAERANRDPHGFDRDIVVAEVLRKALDHIIRSGRSVTRDLPRFIVHGMLRSLQDQEETND
jgi:hypothetical protein